MEQIKFNIIAPTFLLKLFIPKLKERTKTRPAGIIFITSPVGEEVQLPCITSFATSNAYIKQLGSSLQREFKEIDVLYYSSSINDLLFAEKTSPEDNMIDSDLLFRSIDFTSQTSLPLTPRVFEFFALNYWWIFRDSIKETLKQPQKENPNDLL